MSAEVLRAYRYRCDAAQCAAFAMSDTADTPVDWTEIDSIAHQSHAPLPSVKAGRALLRSLDTRSLRSHGRFRLHLCPAHPDALAGHLPQTDNAGGQGASVSCSCGVSLAGSAKDPKALWVRHYEAISGWAEGER